MTADHHDRSPGAGPGGDPGAGVGAFLADVAGFLDPGAVLTDPDRTAAHATDWTRRFRGATPAVLRPAGVEQVAGIVRSARRHRVALVPQGGNTSLVGGATPLAGEVVVDLRRLDRLDPVDSTARQVTVGAGVTAARLAAHCAPAGLEPAVDLASRDTATLGGMVATNAGGIHVVRHGPMRAQVAGLEAVLGNGDVLAANLAGLDKDNTGYDLVGLLCGSEGTLGIVTAARVRLVARPASVAAALVGFSSSAAAVAAAAALATVGAVRAVELMRGTGLDLVGAHLGAPVPLDPVPVAVLLVEATGTADGPGALDSLASAIGRLDGAGETVVADHARDLARLWRWREGHHEVAAGLGVVHKADVTLPAAGLAAFVDAVDALVAPLAPGATTLVYGHAADGNVHVNVVGPEPDDPRVLDAVFGAVLAAGGSISAEHGIGRAKREWLVAQRGEVAVAAMRAVKAALDPDGVCNPAALLGPPQRPARPARPTR